MNAHEVGSNVLFFPRQWNTLRSFTIPYRKGLYSIMVLSPYLLCPLLIHWFIKYAFTGKELYRCFLRKPAKKNFGGHRPWPLQWCGSHKITSTKFSNALQCGGGRGDRTPFRLRNRRLIRPLLVPTSRPP